MKKLKKCSNKVRNAKIVLALTTIIGSSIVCGESAKSAPRNYRVDQNITTTSRTSSCFSGLRNVVSRGIRSVRTNVSKGIRNVRNLFSNCSSLSPDVIDNIYGINNDGSNGSGAGNSGGSRNKVELTKF